MSTRRSTRRNAASAEPAQLGIERRLQTASPPPEPPKKKGRRGKAAAAQAESESDTQSRTVTKVTATSRATSSSMTASSTSTFSKRTTRAAKAAGVGSPLRALGEADLKPQTEKKRKRTRQQAASATPDPEPPRSEPAQDENNDEQGLFFSQSEPQISSPQQNIPIAPSQVEYDVLRDRISQLEARITELETVNASLADENVNLRTQLSSQITTQHVSASSPQLLSLSSSEHFSPTTHDISLHFPRTSQLQTTPQVSANHQFSEFDHDLMHVEEASPVQPVFINSSESAIALLHKIENAAKESPYVEQSMHEDGESFLDNDITMDASPQQSASKTHTNQSTTPARPIASPSGFFSRSFSAIKSKLGFSTPAPQAPSPAAAPSATPSKPLPPPNSLTEALSVPPTPVGERVQTPTKKKKSNPMLKALLKGVEPKDRAKAEEWAKHIIPQLKNDRAFREKRKRLETPILVKDLNHFPSAKPWETGFGDPLGDLDDEDVVPGWAVYLDMMAEEEEHKTKKHKTMHEVTTDDDDIMSINEQYAASSSALSSPKLHDSHGQSASLQDFHPRRSIDPSPMFETPVSHQRGGNVFSELQGHDTAAQIRANDRESLQHATTEMVHTHNPDMGSFSVPDDSDDEDSTMISETADTDAAPLWTQAPPPAPVPAHAPLPGGPPADAAPASTAQQPVDEVERQRQRLMKHTPAKPSRLREATYPSPSLLSDAGNESILAATPIQVAASVASMFDDMPGAEPLDIDEEDLATANAFVVSDAWKQQLAANPWPAAILTYESDEEDLSPA
ncbi:Nn.00g014200.m01.CDS01 [Neocucurbitaria sp. VM-36]